MAYFLMKLLSKCLMAMPDSLRRKVGDLIGALTWLIVPPKRKHMALRNVMLALGLNETAAMDIVKRSWTRFGRMITEVLIFPKMKRDISRYVRIEGKEHLDQVLAGGGGAVLASAHSGNWELLGAALALNGYPTVGVVQKQADAEMDKLINEYRRLAGMHVTYKAGVREMVRLLGEGWLVGLAMDQDAGKDGAILEFFGRKASCAQGPAFLARMKRTPIVPAFITENADGVHTVLVQAPLWVEITGDKHEDIRKMTEQLMGIIEEHVKQYPSEWFWMHNRWKSCE